MILNLISNYINFINNFIFTCFNWFFSCLLYGSTKCYLFLFIFLFFYYLSIIRASYFVICCILIFNLISVVLNFMFINYFRFDMDFLDINLDWDLEDIESDIKIEDLVKQTEIMNYDNVCSICLNKFNKNNDSKIIMYYICSNQHYFHKKCINQWLKIKLDCLFVDKR